MEIETGEQETEKERHPQKDDADLNFLRGRDESGEMEERRLIPSGGHQCRNASLISLLIFLFSNHCFSQF
jgi:hypothetical protein